MEKAKHSAAGELKGLKEMDKTITTYEELYCALFSLDRGHRIYKTDDTCFHIKLDEEYDIAVYENRDGEVYLEYNVKGEQLTHYHPDYQEAYEDLAEVVTNPEKELERLKKDTEASKRAFYIGMASLLVLFVILFVALWRFGRWG